MTPLFWDLVVLWVHQVELESNHLGLRYSEDVLWNRGMRPFRPLFVMRVLLMQKWVPVMPPFIQDIVLHSASLSARMFCFWWFMPKLLRFAFLFGREGKFHRTSLSPVVELYCHVCELLIATWPTLDGAQRFATMGGIVVWVDCVSQGPTPPCTQNFSHFKFSTSFCCAFLSCFLHTHTHTSQFPLGEGWGKSARKEWSLAGTVHSLQDAWLL